jgi:methylisocitrate lyase
LLGAPDVSLLAMTEMADHYARIVDASPLPVLVDGDTGFGNSTNVARTVRAFERAGAAALFIEDQTFPKRCGHTSGKSIISAVEMVEKLFSAVDARIDQELVIMARTDALAIDGIDAAIERGQLYREAGADMIFVEALTNEEEMRRVCAEINAPCLVSHSYGSGVTPALPTSRFEELWEWGRW